MNAQAMAEARAAVEYTRVRRGVPLVLDGDGLHVQLKLTVPSVRRWPRILRKRAIQVGRLIAGALFPYSALMMVLTVAATTVAVLQSPEDAWIRSGPLAELVWWCGTFVPYSEGLSNVARLVMVTSGAALVGFFALAMLRRAIVRELLKYKGYLYKARVRPTPWELKIWFVVTRFFMRGFGFGAKPQLYSLQSSLPPLPVPPLEHTVRRFLDSARPLMDQPDREPVEPVPGYDDPEQEPPTPAIQGAADEALAAAGGPGAGSEWARLQQLAEDFLAKEGPTLQSNLALKWWMSSNYITDWWEKYIYLAGRGPIMVNSNYYVLDSATIRPTNNQCARAGTIVHCYMRFMCDVDDQAVAPVMGAGGVVPLSMDQYRRIFRTTRLPGREIDELRTLDDSRHVAVLCKGHYYRVPIMTAEHVLVDPVTLTKWFEEIKEDASSREADPMEARICALTSGSRSPWAEARDQHFGDGINRRSLSEIERACLFVCLDDEEIEQHDWTRAGKAGLHGNHNRWFDKSINLIFCASGKMIVNCEHSWADAPVISHVMESVMIVTDRKGDLFDKKTDTLHPDALERINRAADATGCCVARNYRTARGAVCERPQLESWRRLQWNLSRRAERAIQTAIDEAEQLAADTDLAVVKHDAYGKQFMKKCRVSPDAYIQMAMQLAYYRQQGHFDATYESSMTRLYLEGRTETIRSCTDETCAFVRAMVGEVEATPAEKLRLLRAASEAHVTQSRDCMAGLGVDRHLFGLYIVSVGKDIESPFLKAALSSDHALYRPWKLSTSQQPQCQTVGIWSPSNPADAEWMSPGGGFGPVHDQGYGISYMVASETDIFFHISSKKSAKRTNSKLMGQAIFKAMEDMRAVLSQALEQQKK